MKIGEIGVVPKEPQPSDLLRLLARLREELVWGRELRRRRGEIAAWLASERALRLKHPEARILSCRGHLDALGYRITRQGIQCLPRALRRFRQRVVSELTGEERIELERSVAATVGVVVF